MAKKAAVTASPERDPSRQQCAIRKDYRGVLWHGGKKYKAGDTLDVSLEEIAQYGYKPFIEVLPEESESLTEPETERNAHKQE